MSINKSFTVCLLLFAAFGSGYENNKGTCGISSSSSSKTFEITKRGMTWIDALLHCKERRGNLATIRTREEMNQIVASCYDFAGYIHAPPPWSFWIGGTKMGSSRGFYWVSDGSSFSFTDWHSVKYPDVKEPGLDCVQLYRSFNSTWGWRNENCSKERFPICEYF